MDIRQWFSRKVTKRIKIRRGVPTKEGHPVGRNVKDHCWHYVRRYDGMWAIKRVKYIHYYGRSYPGTDNRYCDLDKMLLFKDRFAYWTWGDEADCCWAPYKFILDIYVATTLHIMDKRLWELLFLRRCS